MFPSVLESERMKRKMGKTDGCGVEAVLKGKGKRLQGHATKKGLGPSEGILVEKGGKKLLGTNAMGWRVET